MDLVETSEEAIRDYIVGLTGNQRQLLLARDGVPGEVLTRLAGQDRLVSNISTFSSDGASRDGVIDRFKTCMFHSVFPVVNFTDLAQRKYGSYFCDGVFKAIGERKTQEGWEQVILKNAECAVGRLRSNLNKRVKEQFIGKSRWC
jgi:hypothetical protein